MLGVLLLLLLPGCRLLRPSAVGIGPGGAIFPEDGGVAATPALVLETRSLPTTGRQVGLVRRSTLTFHDPSATRATGRWYFDGPQGIDDPSVDFFWYAFLWPSLVLSPLAGSDLAQGYGLLFQPAPELPWFEAGPQLSFWLRPSSSTLKADLTLGVWGGVGFPIRPSLDLAFRTSLQTPVYHSIVDQTGPIVTGSLMLCMRREAVLDLPARRPPADPPAPPPEPDDADEEDGDDTGSDEDDTGDSGDTG